MKITKSLIFLIICTSFGFSQNVDDSNLRSAISSLNEEQRLEFFRSKITIEKIGLFGGKVTYRNWNAFQGLDNQLKTKEFFSITGYEAEAPDFALRTKLPWRLFSYFGLTLGLYGLVYEVWDFDKDESTKPFVVPGILLFAGGAYSLYYYITHPQLVTYELAREIASAYNNKLIDQIKNK